MDDSSPSDTEVTTATIDSNTNNSIMDTIPPPPPTTPPSVSPEEIDPTTDDDPLIPSSSPSPPSSTQGEGVDQDQEQEDQEQEQDQEHKMETQNQSQPQDQSPSSQTQTLQIAASEDTVVHANNNHNNQYSSTPPPRGRISSSTSSDGRTRTSSTSGIGNDDGEYDDSHTDDDDVVEEEEEEVNQYWNRQQDGVDGIQDTVDDDDDDDVEGKVDGEQQDKMTDPIVLEGVATATATEDTIEGTDSPSNNNNNNSPNKTGGEVIRNRFASWKNNVIQSNVLQTAQKNLKEKRIDIQKVQKNLKEKRMDIQKVVKSIKITPSWSEDQSSKEDDTSNHHRDNGIEANVSDVTETTDNTARSNVYLSNPNGAATTNRNTNSPYRASRASIASGTSSGIGYGDDDSYLSTDDGNTSYNDDESQGTSIFVGKDDAYSIASSVSSVHVSTPLHRPQAKRVGSKSTFNRRGSNDGNNGALGLNPSHITTTGEGGLSPTNIAQDEITTSTSYRGRYNFSLPSPSADGSGGGRILNMIGKNTPNHLLQQIQQKVIPTRATTPPPPPSPLISPKTMTSTLSSSNTTIITPPLHPQHNQLQQPHQQQHQQQQQLSYDEMRRREAYSQLIRKAPDSERMKVTLGGLKDGEYVMMLGPGMLGVNLKQTYLPRRGVYVDHMIAGGNAIKSKAIRIGDTLLTVGAGGSTTSGGNQKSGGGGGREMDNVDVRKGTIWDVPNIIAASRRPAVLVFDGGHGVGWAKMDYVAVAIGMINRIRGEIRRGFKSQMPIGSGVRVRIGPPSTQTSSSSLTSVTDNTNMDGNTDDGDGDGDNVKKTTTQQQQRRRHQLHAINPPSPPVKLREALEGYATRRNNQVVPISALTAAARNDPQFHHVLRETFVTCCIDSRRLPFFAAYLSNEDTFLRHHTTVPDSGGNMGGGGSGGDMPTGSTRLMLYLELITFRDLYGVAPEGRRNDHASRIAYKFLLPTPTTPPSPNNNLTQQQPPALMTSTPKPSILEEAPFFDMRAMFPTSALQSLQTILQNKQHPNQQQNQQPSVVVPRDVFATFEAYLEASLATATVASFLLSDECARMRAYMRGTVPYVDPSIEAVLREAVVTTTTTTIDSATTKEYRSAARNHATYMMTYLLCQAETDVISDKNFDNSALGMKGKASSEIRRVNGATGGLSCAFFIQRVLVKRIVVARELLKQNQDNTATNTNGGDNGGSSNNVAKTTTNPINPSPPSRFHYPAFQNLLQSFEYLWETFIAPSGGSLDASSHSNEIQTTLDDVRRTLLLAVSPPVDLSLEDRGLRILKCLVDGDGDGGSSGLEVLLKRLSDELVYEYTHTSHTKYRNHILHEWMSAEANQHNTNTASTFTTEDNNNHPIITTTEDDTIAFDEDDDRRRLTAPAIPNLPSGCISRLMRKVELPEGVSRHRPRRRPTAVTSSGGGGGRVRALLRRFDSFSSSSVHADYAVLFGTDEGRNGIPPPSSSPQRQKKVNNDSTTTNVRRYLCVPLSGEEEMNEGDNDDRLRLDAVPPALESYASVPSMQHHHFSDSMDDISQITHDGWQVSLINFMMPISPSSSSNSNSSGQDDGDGNNSLYGVSLVFQSRPDATQEDVDDYTIELSNNSPPPSLSSSPAGPVVSYSRKNDTDGEGDNGSSNSYNITIRVKENGEIFQRRLSEQRCSTLAANGVGTGTNEQKDPGFTVGIVLVAKRNSIPAMRETLARLFNDFTGGSAESTTTAKSDDNDQQHQQRPLSLSSAAPLVDILGNFRYADTEQGILRNIIRPYVMRGEPTSNNNNNNTTPTTRWGNQSTASQTEAFQTTALLSLVESIPPIPFALLFLTALLEQKIVFSSKRRSVLLSVSTALKSLLEPLEWTHLFVPLVPLALANDLVQYPAPFILGIPSDEKGSIDLVRSLPDDVTLVDVDVGRVILAKTFSHDFEAISRSRRGNNSSSSDGAGLNDTADHTAAKLRAQVLYLAEGLGAVLGSLQNEPLWNCDSPSLGFDAFGVFSGGDGGGDEGCRKVEIVRSMSREFINELLSGSTTCCFWMEDETGGNEISQQQKQNNIPTTMTNESGGGEDISILFDEDRYFHLKTLRADGCYLPLLLSERYFTSDDTGGGKHQRQQEQHESEEVSSAIPRPNLNQANSTKTTRLDCKSDFALDPVEFNLVLETFLRGQGISSWISSRPKGEMAFW